MSHLIKDHKLVGEDGLPPTRPVVSACPSERAQGVEVLSTEHMLQKLTAFNHKWDTAKPSTEPCLISTDATALCPSIDHLSSAKIVRREVMLSKHTVEATDWREMAPYLRMTVHPKLWGPWRIRKYLPWNSEKTSGTTPSITGTEAIKGTPSGCFPTSHPQTQLQD